VASVTRLGCPAVVGGTGWRTVGRGSRRAFVTPAAARQGDRDVSRQTFARRCSSRFPAGHWAAANS